MTHCESGTVADPSFRAVGACGDSNNINNFYNLRELLELRFVAPCQMTTC